MDNNIELAPIWFKTFWQLRNLWEVYSRLPIHFPPLEHYINLYTTHVHIHPIKPKTPLRPKSDQNSTVTKLSWWSFNSREGNWMVDICDITLPSIVEIFEIEYFNRFWSSKLEQWWKYFQDQNIKTKEKRLIEEWLQYHRHINTWLNYWVVMENQSKWNYNSYARVYSHGKIYWRGLKQFTNSIIVLQSL